MEIYEKQNNDDISDFVEIEYLSDDGSEKTYYIDLQDSLHPMLILTRELDCSDDKTLTREYIISYEHRYKPNGFIEILKTVKLGSKILSRKLYDFHHGMIDVMYEIKKRNSIIWSFGMRTEYEK
jgi:hypothetical protein